MTAALPGLTVDLGPRPADPTPLRSDVAGFVGSTRRGPVGQALRVDGQAGYQRQFGGLDARAVMTYGVRGYFQNGGQTAWVVRVSGQGAVARAAWQVTGLDGFPVPAYRVEATSPGSWGDTVEVRVRHRPRGPAGTPEVDVRVAAPGEAVEVFRGLPPAELPARLAAASALVRFLPTAAAEVPTEGQRAAEWVTLQLAGGQERPPGLADYLRGIEALGEQPEVAIVAVPGLDQHLAGPDRDQAVEALLEVAAAQLDRLVVLDVPGQLHRVDEAAGWIGRLIDPSTGLTPSRLRAGAAYHPWLRVKDPLGPAAAPLRAVPSSGHVAGVISRLDRERGPHHTPANTALLDAVDLEDLLDDREELAVFTAGLNLLRCSPGRGLQVWGGRTLDPREGGRFVAHRRLLHRLVRAIRRVAEPLVFDVNGPELRLTLVRALTSVLLEAFRAGALKGDRPEQGFRVRCDDRNNPPEQDPGMVVCDLEVAPAAPMEFIRLRLLVGQEGRLEVIEA